MKEALQPAATLLAEAVQHVENAGVAASPSRSQHSQLQREVTSLKNYIERLEAFLAPQ